MAQVKNHEVDSYLKQPKPAHRIVLLYGPDAGLVSERAELLAKNSGSDLNDPFSTIVLDADDAAADPQRLADEAHTVSMFGGQRLVRIKGSTQKNLANAVQPVLDQPPVDALIIIEAGDLKKSSPLRSRIEKAGSAVALPCYQDQARALQTVVDQELDASGLTIEPPARKALIDLLGDNRMASRGEVQKLCLYVGDRGQITLDDIHKIVGDASSLALDTVVDAASTGDIANMEHTFKRLMARGTAVFLVVNAVQRHFQALHLMRSQMESGNQPASALVNSMRPPVNFQRKDRVIQAVNLWRQSALERVLSRLEALSLDTRTQSSLAVALTSTALLAIAIEARQARR
ncbi:MAG: DNA polymerase III subunit delta [Rhizobiaceae bacterium]